MMLVESSNEMIQKLEASVALLREECDTLQAEHAEAKNECVELMTQVSDGNAKTQDLEEEIVKLREEVSGLEAKSSELEERVSNVTGALHASEKNIEYLKVNEAKLEQELEHSEHLRLHHEGESQSEATRANEIEAELKQLREDIVKANMALNEAVESSTEASKLNDERQAEITAAPRSARRETASAEIYSSQEALTELNQELVQRSGPEAKNTSLLEAVDNHNASMGELREGIIQVR